MKFIELYRKPIQLSPVLGDVFERFTVGPLRARILGVRVPVRVALYLMHVFYPDTARRV